MVDNEATQEVDAPNQEASEVDTSKSKNFRNSKKDYLYGGGSDK